jgi:hypothetical protein
MVDRDSAPGMSLALYLRMAHAISAQTQVLHYTLLSHAFPRVVNGRAFFLLFFEVNTS